MSLNPPDPTYWSGTGCEFSFEASNNTAIITGAEIAINGATVYFEAITPPRVMIGGTVYFDSTHFANGTPITVTVTVTINVSPGTVQQSVTAPAYNVATIYGRNEWEISGPPSASTAETDQYLQQMNHDTSRTNTSLGWNASAILNDLGPCTVFYVATHGGDSCDGNPDEFVSDLDEITQNWAYVYPSDVYSVRYSSVNGGTPPMNFAWINACSTGCTNDFADGLLYPTTYVDSTNYTPDQAEMGWQIHVLVDTFTSDAQIFWSDLAAGYTVHHARTHMVQVYENDSSLTDDQAGQDAAVWGDYYARLHNVYTGDDTAPANGWYRVPGQ